MVKEATEADKHAKEILKAQMGMLDDSAYLDSLHKAIKEEKVCAEYAAVSSADSLAEEFKRLENEYLRNRAEDIRQVAARLALTLTGESSHIKLTEPVVLFAKEFTPAQLAENIKTYMPDFTIDYKPDSRQAIADSWPYSLDDSHARKDWGWKEEYDMDALTRDMLTEIEKKLKNSKN